MLDLYEEVTPGHLWQKRPTGEVMKYDAKYLNYYESLDNGMSHLRTALIWKYIDDIHSICDVGYGSGDFLKYWNRFFRIENPVKCFGYDVSGYELPDEIKIVSRLEDIDVDVCCFFDSIEHNQQRDLVPILTTIKAKHVVISVPWFHSHAGEEWFMTWKHRKENEHFHHFDVFGLASLLHQAGYKVVHVSNSEDTIRKPVSYLPNILTMIGSK